MENMLLEIDGSIGLNKITGELKKSWGKYLIYHIYNVEETDYVSFYENLASELGSIQDCRPVNSADKKFLPKNPDDPVKKIFLLSSLLHIVLENSNKYSKSSSKMKESKLMFCIDCIICNKFFFADWAS